MRRLYKNFVMNLAVRSANNNKTRTSTIAQTQTLEPKMVSQKNTPIQISHYDDNQPISLSLPESLCIDHASNTGKEKPLQSHHSQNLDNIEDAVIISESQSITDSSEPYSDANSFFKAEHDELENNEEKANKFITSKSLESTLQNEETVEQNDLEEHQNKEIQAEEIPNTSEADRLADKKFEEDLHVILNQKNANDRQREQNNPAESSKNRDNGLVDESDQEFKKKLKNRHAIFDQIAQSMQMANTYDFGAIAMDKKIDDLEEETNEEFTNKIQDLLVEDKDKEEKKPSYSGNKKEEDKILTEDFLDDINQLNELSSEQSKKTQDFAEDAIVLDDQEDAQIEPKKEEQKEIQSTSDESLKTIKLSQQASFNSTISIKHRFLRSRIFSATGGTVAVTIDSSWIPEGCSDITNLNVTLTQDINWGIDNEKGTKRFRIGTSDTKTWSGLPSGNYYLTFFFVNNTNPHCELKGTINVIT